MFKLAKLIVVTSFLSAAATGCAVDQGLDDETETPQAHRDAPDAIECAEVADRLAACGFQLAGDENDNFLICEAGGFTADELRCLHTAPCGKIALVCFDFAD